MKISGIAVYGIGQTAALQSGRCLLSVQRGGNVCNVPDFLMQNIQEEVHDECDK